MIAALLLLGVLQDVPTLSTEGLRDRTGDGVVFLEVSADEEELFVGQAFTVSLRIGVAEEFVEGGLIQLFRRPLDLPVQVQAAWLDDLPGAAPLGALLPGTTTVSLDGEVQPAVALDPVERDGRRYRRLDLSRPYVATSPGDITLPATTLRFAYATRFREDFVNGRVPEDRIDGYVVSQPHTLTVRELPLAGQPPEFTGAVGRFSIEASAEPQDLVVGERLALTLTISGSGNLAHFAPPPLGALRGLQVLGSTEELVGGRRVITYDLETALPGTRVVPPIQFAFFDPRSGAYATEQTSPISILVRPEPSQATPAPEPSESPEPSGFGPLLWLLLLPLAALALLLARLLARRARARSRPDRDTLRLQQAAHDFRERSRGSEVDPADSLVEFLASWLECPAASVVSPDLGRRLRASGLSEEDAARVVDLVERLHAPRYGGPRLANGLESARALVDELVS